MAYSGTVTITDITDTSARAVVTDTDTHTSDYTVDFTLSVAGTTVASPSVVIPAGELSGSTVLESLTPNTEYTLQGTAAIAPGPTTSSFVTKATGYDDPKTATQEQWEDLVARIKAKAEASSVGLARELTADDYDYPTGSSPTSVAAWLLAPGLYTAAESVWIRICAGSTMTVSAKKNFIVLNGPGTSNKTIVDLSNRDGLNMGITMYYVSTSGSCVGTYLSFLTRDDVVDNLNSISDTNPLSANQGRLLNNKIEPLQALANYYTAIEKSTGATWIDGLTIYKKTITYSIATTGNNTTAHGITNLGHVVKLEGALVSSSGDSKALNYNDMNNAAVTYINSSSVITYVVGNDAVGRTAYVTIYYTKSS